MESVCHKKLKGHFNSFTKKKKSQIAEVCFQAKGTSMHTADAISISNLHGFSNIPFLLL